VRLQDRAALDRLVQSLPQLEAEWTRRQSCAFRQYYPDTGPVRRELYPWVLAFFRAGLVHRERLILAANRVGKTQAAAYESSAHLTGEYPPWWEGRRFVKPVRWHVAGDTMQTTRDIIQVSLMGPHEGVPRQEWAGMIPPHRIHHVTRRTGGVANCLEYVYVRHRGPDGKDDGLSSVQFRSYDQGRRSFQGFEAEGIWLDEEPPEMTDEMTGDIYSECLLRLMTTDGLLVSTFTPLRGLTRFIEQYLRSAVSPDTNGAEIAAMQRFFPDGLDLDDDEQDSVEVPQ
jgi:phage terminase large subunit-like protein